MTEVLRCHTGNCCGTKAFQTLSLLAISAFTLTLPVYVLKSRPGKLVYRGSGR